jgi:hypothetical protein
MMALILALKSPALTPDPSDYIRRYLDRWRLLREELEQERAVSAALLTVLCGLVDAVDRKAWASGDETLQHALVAADLAIRNAEEHS